MNDENDFLLLLRPGLREKAIAEVLRNGPSERFCKLLAAMLDPVAIHWQTPAAEGQKRPTHKKTPYRLKLVGQPYRKKGTGKADIAALGKAMLGVEERHQGRKTKEALEEKRMIEQHFAVSKKTAERAKKQEADARELFAWIRESGRDKN
jgi:hypothetical protein